MPYKVGPLAQVNRYELYDYVHLLDAYTTSIAYKRTYFLGVLRRDISPGNMLITDDPEFDGGLLIDWDLSKVKGSDNEQTGTLRRSRSVRAMFEVLF
jgi:hypothetical protein